MSDEKDPQGLQKEQVDNQEKGTMKEEADRQQQPKVVSVAPKDTQKGSGFKILLLALMVLQNSSTVLVGRYTRSGVPKDEQFVVSHFVLVAEIAKLVLSCFLEMWTTEGRLLSSLKENVLDRPLDALKISVPALLYLVQNTLLYVALSNLSAPLFQVTYQSKLVTTAIVSVIMLNRKYSPKQWVCLVILSVGVATVVLGEKKDDKKDNQDDVNPAGGQSLIVGLLAVAVACVSSALAGVYFEKVLKKATTNADGTTRLPVSMWMRNIQLAFFSVVIAVFQLIFTAGDAEQKVFMHGFTFWVWILVSLQAGGGLLVAAVIKYADNVLKGLATGVSVVAATAFSAVFFKTDLTGQFVAGATAILGSVYFFSNNCPSCLASSAKKQEDNEEDMKKPILPK